MPSRKCRIVCFKGITLNITHPKRKKNERAYIWLECTVSSETSCVTNVDTIPLQWRHDGCDGVPNHRRLDWLLNRLFGCRLKETSKLHVTGICEGNSPVTGEFPSQRASNAENVSIWWRHHVYCVLSCMMLVWGHSICVWNHKRYSLPSCLPDGWAACMHACFIFYVCEYFGEKAIITRLCCTSSSHIADHSNVYIAHDFKK